MTQFATQISREIWEQKYRFRPVGGTPDPDVAATFERVARAAAGVEAEADRARHAHSFADAMADFKFLPGGRILAGAGTGRGVTLFNCFVLGRIEDDLSSIFDSVREAALTMQAGGGIGHDFSTLRPRNALVRSVGASASGPTSFMDVWDAMCRTIMSAGQRRGAMMATLRCDHPDILEFIAAKSDPARLRNFNLSVLVTDAFVRAVKADRSFDLVFEGTVYRTVRARDLWRAITAANYGYAEPGVIFIDRVNAQNNLAYCETISATNPCGEQPLPPYGACLLGAINLTAFVHHPFEAGAGLDHAALRATVRTAVRMLDNVIDVSHYALPQQRREALAKRRIGLGLTGLADALVMVGLGYGTAEGRAFAADTMAAIQAEAYRASAALAAEKGPFPLYDRDALLAAPNVMRLPGEVRDAVARDGLRNGCLTTIAPTGTISLLAGNVSSGIEPIFATSYVRRIRGEGDRVREERVEDFAYAKYRKSFGREPAASHWVTAAELTPTDHLAMQAALQPHVDSAISKTINCPADISPDAFDGLYLTAYDLGLKGCTTFRPNAVTGSVLTPVTVKDTATVEAVEGAGLAGYAGVGKSGSSDAASGPPAIGPKIPPWPQGDDVCAECGSPRMKPDGTCRVCLACGRSTCA